MELFRNSHDALFFAFRFTSQQYAKSPMSKAMQGSAGGGSGKGLIGLDGSAQSGLILASVERLDALQRACIVARFSSRVEPCPCCGGDKPLDEYKQSMMVLANWADQFINKEVSTLRLRFGIVQSYFDRKQTVSALAKSIGVPARTAHDQKNKIWPHLKTLDSNALATIGDMLASMCGEIAG